MHKLISLAVALLPLAVNANSIPLDNSVYWQVQKAATYATVCEGYIDQCDAEAGIYNVINLTTGERREGVVVAETSNPPAARQIEVVSEVCDWTHLDDSYDEDTWPDNPGEYYGVVTCNATCPTGKMSLAF